MEAAATQMSQRLPKLISQGTTIYPSSGRERLSARFIHSWNGFREEVLATISNVSLQGLISVSNSPEGEVYYVGNELGLTGRFVANVAIPVTKAFRNGTTDAHLNTLRFGDYHCIPYTNSAIPDVVMVKDIPDENGVVTSCALRAVGEVKTFWTQPLHPITDTSPDEHKFHLEHPIGQLASYMTGNSLKYGFLTTYHSTIFVRRTENFRFELSPPILWDSYNPSLRQCFLAFGMMLTDEDFQFVAPGIDLTGYAPTQGQVASYRPSYYRSNGRMPASSTTSPHEESTIGSAPSTSHAFSEMVSTTFTMDQVNDRTVFLSSDHHAIAMVQLGKMIRGLASGKMVFEGEFEGRSVIIKSWPESHEVQYANEVGAYLRLDSNEPCFAELLNYGRIICGGFLLSQGYAVILTRMPGVPFSNKFWRELGEQGRMEMTDKLRHAIAILRNRNLVHGDSTKENVLYDPETKNITLIDFEAMVDNTEYHFGIEGPEISRIMEPPFEWF